MRVTAILTGDEEAKLTAALKPRQAKIAIRSAVLKASRDGKTVAKRSLTRKRFGLLAKSLGEKVKTTEERVVGIIGPKAGFSTKIREQKKGARGVEYVADRSGKIVKLKLAKGAKAAKDGEVINPTRYAHLVEKGHKRGKGKSAAPAYAFLKPARDHSARTAPGMIAKELKERIGG